MKKLLFIFVILFFSFTLNAQIFYKNAKKSFHISLEPIISYSNGNLKEAIYRSANKNSKISLLKWDRNIFTYGSKLELQYKKFYFYASFYSSFPKQQSGKMQDSDWQNPKDYSMKTTYSVGSNFTEKNYVANISFFYEFEPTSNFFIAPKIQCEYFFDSFYRKKGAKGWYGQADGKYGSLDGKNHWWYEKEARKYPYIDSKTGKTWNLAGIDYERHSFYFWTGFYCGFKTNRFKTDFGFLFSPFTYFSAEDRHHTAGEDNVYHAIQQDFFTSYKFSFDFSYKISKYFDINLCIEQLIASNIKGDLFIDWAKLESQPSGASAFFATFNFGIKVKLL